MAKEWCATAGTASKAAAKPARPNAVLVIDRSVRSETARLPQWRASRHAISARAALLWRLAGNGMNASNLPGFLAGTSCIEGRAQQVKESNAMADKKYENILIEREGGITFVWLNRPDKRNAMSPGLHADMNDALDWLATDKETKVLVLGGKGEAWCAGQHEHLGLL